MSLPSKIKYRDLDPELQGILSGQELTDGALAELLKKYRKKNEYITEDDIDHQYTQNLIQKINDVRIAFENFKNSFSVLSEDQLSPEFLQKISNIETLIDGLPNKATLDQEFNKIQTQLNSLKASVDNGEQMSALKIDVQSLKTTFEEIQEEIVETKALNDELKQKSTILEQELNNKRSSQDLITIDDLSDEIKSSLTDYMLVSQNVNDFLESINSLSSGYLVSKNIYGNLTSKELFAPFITIREGRTLDDLRSSNPVEGFTAIEPETGKVYVYRNIGNHSTSSDLPADDEPETWPDDDVTGEDDYTDEDTPSDENEAADEPVDVHEEENIPDENAPEVSEPNEGEEPGDTEEPGASVTMDFVEDEQYFNKDTKYWNCFLINYDDNQVFAYITRDGSYVPVSFGKQSTTEQYTVESNSSIDVPLTLKDCGRVTFLYKNMDELSETYGFYIDPRAYVDIAWGESGSKIHNFSDKDITLTVIKK